MAKRAQTRADGKDSDDVMDRLRRTQIVEGQRRAGEEEEDPDALVEDDAFEEDAGGGVASEPTEPEPAPPPRSARREGVQDKGKGEDMGHAASPRRTTRPELTESEKLGELMKWPEVGIRLLRRDKVTGQTPTMGNWHSRPPGDVMDAETWVREWCGGGRYTMQVFNPADRTTPYLTRQFDLPGEELDPLDLRQEQERAQQQQPVVAPVGQPVAFGQPVPPQQQLDAWGRPSYMASVRPRMSPSEDRLPLRGRGWRDDDDDDDRSKGMFRLFEKMLERQMGGGGGGDYLHEQERRDHERRLDDERRDRERREEEDRKRREEEKKEYEQRMAEERRRWEERAEEQSKQHQAQLDELRKQREEDQKAREAKEREDERRRAEDDRKRHEEHLQREREAHKEEVQRREDKGREEMQRERERFEQLIKEQNQQADLRQKELTDRLNKSEEDRRHEMAGLQEKNQQKETTTMLERIQQENRTLLERVLTEQTGKEDPVLARMIEGQTAAQTQASNFQAQMLTAVVNQLGGKDSETMKLFLDVVNPERNVAVYEALGKMSTQNVEVLTSLIQSGILQQLQGDEQNPWVQVVEKITEALAGGAEAVMAAKQQGVVQQNQAIRVAQLQARGQAPGLALSTGTPPAAAPPAAASFGGAPPGATRVVQLPEAGPLRQPVQVTQAAPAAPSEPPLSPELVAEEAPETVAQPVEVAVEDREAAAVPLARIRAALVEGKEPGEVAEMLYDYVSFLARWGVLPPVTEEAIFGNPTDAVPQLLATAVQTQPAPPVEVEEEYVEAIVVAFVSMVEQERATEEAERAAEEVEGVVEEGVGEVVEEGASEEVPEEGEEEAPDESPEPEK